MTIRMTANQILCAETIYKNPHMTTKQISDATGFTIAAVSRMIDRIKRKTGAKRKDEIHLRYKQVRHQVVLFGFVKKKELVASNMLYADYSAHNLRFVERPPVYVR